MNTEIAFNKVIRAPNSWCDEMNVDVMMENHIKLKRIIDKMFFSVWPKNPKLFTLLISKPHFADMLIDSMLRLEIRNLNKIWFTEYSDEDKQKLIEIGIMGDCITDKGTITVIITKSENDCFVCIFP